MGTTRWQHGAITTAVLPLQGPHGQFGVTVHIVQGENRAALIDSGAVWGYSELERVLDEMGLAKSAIKIVFATHEHMDHVGNNGQLVDDTGCLIAAHPGRADLIADNALNARSFVHRFPLVEPVFDLEPEYLDWMGPHGSPVNLALSEGMVIGLTGPSLEVLELPGHSPCEIGFFESTSRALVLGDTLMPDGAPFLYLYENPTQMRDTCRRIQRLVLDRDVTVVLSGHERPTGGPDAVEWAERCLRRIQDIEDAIVGFVRRSPGIPLGPLRDAVVVKFGKAREWRALITISGHLEELCQKGVLEPQGEGWVVVGGG